MPAMLRIIRIFAAAIFVAGGSAAVCALEAPLELKWAALVPVETAKPKAKPFFSGATPVTPGSGYEPPAPNAESKWMSGAGKVTASSAPAPVVAELNGKRVRIGGYVVPLDFDATKVTEFLLVPFVGACIHVPPPPANQIIYVKSAAGIALKGEFDPVYVTGTLTTEGQFTGLAETGYSIVADAVDAK
jgi:uncharacterized protein